MTTLERLVKQVRDAKGVNAVSWDKKFVNYDLARAVTRHIKRSPVILQNDKKTFIFLNMERRLLEAEINRIELDDWIDNKMTVDHSGYYYFDYYKALLEYISGSNYKYEIVFTGERTHIIKRTYLLEDFI